MSEVPLQVNGRVVTKQQRLLVLLLDRLSRASPSTPLSHSLSFSLSLSQSLTLSLSLSLTHTLSLSLTHTHSLPHSLSHSHSLATWGQVVVPVEEFFLRLETFVELNGCPDWVNGRVLAKQQRPLIP